MSDTYEEASRRIARATAHLGEAERLLARVDLADLGAAVEPLRDRIRRCAADVSVLCSRA